MAEGKKYRLEAIVSLQDKFSRVANKITKVNQKLGKAFKGVGKVSIEAGKKFTSLATKLALGLGGIASGAVFSAIKLAKFDNVVRQTETSFKRVAKAMKIDYKQALAGVQKATDGTVSKLDAMRISTKLMRMGLAKTPKQLELITRMAYRMGDQTKSVAERVEDFSLMLSNQAVMRLDNFGISSGRVRKRILELQKANKGLTRETAFMMAVMEEGKKQLNILGDAVNTPQQGFARLQASMKNLWMTIVKDLEPAFGGILNILADIADRVSEYLSNIDFADIADQVSELLTVFTDTGGILDTIESKLKWFVDVAFPKIKAFVEKHKADLILLGKIMLGVAGALMAISVAAGILSAVLSPVNLLFMALVGIIFILKKAWDSNFMGMRDKLIALWTVLKANLIPFLQKVKVWVGIAFEKLSSWWRKNGPVIIWYIKMMWNVFKLVAKIVIMIVIKIVKMFIWIIKVGHKIGLWKALFRAATAPLRTLWGIMKGIYDYAHKFYNYISWAVNKLKNIHMPRMPWSKHAGGGFVNSGMQLVGERGPELVQLPRGSRVYTANETRKMLGQGANIVININADLGTVDAVKQALEDSIPVIRRKLNFYNRMS